MKFNIHGQNQIDFAIMDMFITFRSKQNLTSYVATKYVNRDK